MVGSEHGVEVAAEEHLQWGIGTQTQSQGLAHGPGDGLAHIADAAVWGQIQ